MNATKKMAMALVIAATTSACATTGHKASALQAPGAKSLAFQLPDVQGKVVRSADYTGRVLVVDVWATWCAPCKKAMPFYAEMQKRHEARGLTVLAINVDSGNDSVNEYLAAQPLPFPVLRDPGSEYASTLDLEMVPTTMIVGRDGRVLYVHSGFSEQDAAILEAKVLEALGEPDVTRIADAPTGSSLNGSAI